MDITYKIENPRESKHILAIDEGNIPERRRKNYKLTHQRLEETLETWPKI